MTSPASLIRDSGSSLIRLGEYLAHAHGVQWLPPLGRSTRNDTSEKASGLVSNPTMDTATDPRRLRVRAAVVEAETLLASIRGQADAAADKLEVALQEWAGDRA